MSKTLKLIGGNDGEYFSFTGENNGASLERICVWVGPSQVKAVSVWLSDGRDKTFGSPEGEPMEHIFEPGETITSLSLWGNGNGTRLGGIKFKNVGSGFCLGVKGRSRSDIHCLGFVFLNNIQSVALTDVSYPTIKQVIPQVALEEIKSTTYRNDSSVRQQQTLETSEKISRTSSWSVSENIAATFSVEVKSGIPGIGESSAGLSTTVGRENTYSQENKNEKTETLSASIEVPPRKKVDVNITVGRCSFDLPYTGTVRMSCTNSSVFSFQTKGRYKGVTYTDINIDTKESDL